MKTCTFMRCLLLLLATISVGCEQTDPLRVKALESDINWVLKETVPKSGVEIWLGHRKGELAAGEQITLTASVRHFGKVPEHCSVTAIVGKDKMEPVPPNTSVVFGSPPFKFIEDKGFELGHFENDERDSPARIPYEAKDTFHIRYKVQIPEVLNRHLYRDIELELK